jgi:hypothetical protein
MATGINVHLMRAVHKHLSDALQQYDADCAAKKAAGTDTGVNAPAETPKPSPELGGQDSDPLGINRLGRERNTRGLG